MSNQPFKKVKGITQIQHSCGARYDNCKCGVRAFCPSCGKCFQCQQRRGDIWALDPRKKIRFDMKQADKDRGNDLIIPRPTVVIGKNLEILGKGGRIIKAKGLRRKQDMNV